MSSQSLAWLPVINDYIIAGPLRSLQCRDSPTTWFYRDKKSPLDYSSQFPHLLTLLNKNILCPGNEDNDSCPGHCHSELNPRATTFSQFIRKEVIQFSFDYSTELPLLGNSWCHMANTLKGKPCTDALRCVEIALSLEASLIFVARNNFYSVWLSLGEKTTN